MTASDWDPAEYARFRDQRAQPFLDLMPLVRSRLGMRVADLGCGTGEMTRRLHDHLAASDTVGIDSSASMLALSRPFAGKGLRFRQQDITQFAAEAAAGQPYDLIFSNAALQWLPDHRSLLGRLTAALTPNGQLAFQVRQRRPPVSDGRR
jgi:trans-aconitate 2-methyltransferase